MNVRGRLARLEALRGPENGGLPGKTRSLKGLDHEAVCDAVEDAVADEDAGLLEAVDALALEAERTPRLRYEGGAMVPWLGDDGEQLFETHHFSYWLWGLGLGSWSLPLKMPRVILQAFNDKHCALLRRCEDCLTALPHSDGYRHWAACPTCGSDYLSYKQLWMPGGAHYEYTPLRHTLRDTPR